MKYVKNPGQILHAESGLDIIPSCGHECERNRMDSVTLQL